ncbi:olfactory receptor 14C36-like [Thamnophis elegans]|uniref:olfactory receptor 14C36-like n=1 Tax=Thamnophis elegans TaxID=35005 RepID=UPI0013779D94|nr:olfactory receptor 14C36-like [Thamnophis elegans]
MFNCTSTDEFLLLTFSEIRELQIMHFFVFLILYLVAISGNLSIIIAVTLDYHLHSPMYFFLMNLAMLDLGSISVAVPKSMANSLLNNTSISYSGCVAQVFFYVFFAGSDLALLTVMAYDRYVAICNPLQYERIMHKRACIQMAISAWVSGILYATLHTSGTFSLSFYSNYINQFFCEIPQLLKLSCSDLYQIEVAFLILGCCIGLICFIFITESYREIFKAVLRIPSKQVSKKALSTCLPHLIVVSIFIFSLILAYERPPTKTSSNFDIAFAVIYTIIPPILNPFIYSVRNKEIKIALWKLLDLGDLSQLT